MNHASIDMLTFVHGYSLEIKVEDKLPFQVLLEVDKFPTQLEENLKKYDIKELTIFHHNMLKKGFSLYIKNLNIILK